MQFYLVLILIHFQFQILIIFTKFCEFFIPIFINDQNFHIHHLILKNFLFLKFILKLFCFSYYYLSLSNYVLQNLNAPDKNNLYIKCKFHNFLSNLNNFEPNIFKLAFSKIIFQ